jgi:hypothetical protein
MGKHNAMKVVTDGHINVHQRLFTIVVGLTYRTARETTA